MVVIAMVVDVIISGVMIAIAMVVDVIVAGVMMVIAAMVVDIIVAGVMMVMVMVFGVNVTNVMRRMVRRARRRVIAVDVIGASDDFSRRSHRKGGKNESNENFELHISSC
jgi:hypothetical protein